MDFRLNHAINSPSSSSSSSSSTPNPPTTIAATATAAADADADPMHSWWESVSKARSRIHALSSILHDSSSNSSSSFSFSSLADSDRPALSLLSSPTAYSLVSSALSSPLSGSGSGSDPLCQWLYDTYLSSDPHLRLVVLSFLPLLSALYLSRVHSSDSPSLAGFEAVLLALYASETKFRNGKPLLISIPDLSQPSLYHTPRRKNNPTSPAQSRPSVGVLSPPLEPQIAVKSTKRACIVGVAFDSYYKQISQMPSWSKLEFCRSVAVWAGQDCSCKREFDRDDDEFENCTSFSENGNEIEAVVEEMGKLEIERNEEIFEPKATRIPLPWEILQPALRILGHCLLAPLNSQDVKDAAAMAARSLYARATHDLVPQAILATRSLIQLDRRARAAAKLEVAAEVKANASSNANTPSKAKKPEILLVSK